MPAPLSIQPKSFTGKENQESGPYVVNISPGTANPIGKSVTPFGHTLPFALYLESQGRTAGSVSVTCLHANLPTQLLLNVFL